MAQPRVMVRDSAEVAAAGADWLAARLAEAVAARGRASLALSGGTSPRPMYQELARRPVEWGRITLLFVDDRCVPPDHEKSNYRMVAESLLAGVAPASVHRMPGERPDRDAAAADYARLVPDAVDVMLLGMGDDGHTASLFPGTDWSVPTGARCLATRAPVAPHERLTLSPEVLRAARRVLVQVAGAGKAPVVEIALMAPPDPVRWPIHIVRDTADWLLDGAAASQLSEEKRDG